MFIDPALKDKITKETWEFDKSESFISYENKIEHKRFLALFVCLSMLFVVQSWFFYWNNEPITFLPVEFFRSSLHHPFEWDNYNYHYGIIKCNVQIPTTSYDSFECRYAMCVCVCVCVRCRVVRTSCVKCARVCWFVCVFVPCLACFLWLPKHTRSPTPPPE